MATGQSYVDPVLTSLSQKYTNGSDDFIARKLFPVIVVDKPTGKYWAYNKDNLRAGGTNIDLRTGRSKTSEITFGKSLKDFGPLQEHALKDFISKDEYKFVDSPLNIESDSVENLNEVMTLAEEISLATMLRDTSIVTNNITLSGTSQFSDYANSDPFVTIKNRIIQQRNTSFKRPNTIAFGWDVWLQLVDHPKILERIKYTQTGVVGTADFIKLFAPYGITQVFVGAAMYDATTEGQTGTPTSVWGKDIIIGFVQGTPSLRAVNGGYTLVLRDGKYVDKWDENDPKGTYVRNNDYYDQMLFASELFSLIKNAVA
ncbi:hypothetical protein [Curtobacterium sp. MCSS17_007]|uniref:major capsid protein n=1 Tax=Curtobacterium sp. MCSS17_007 TaxID=2175646 RepID=UPI000DA9A4DC|nr:hypothetical protein [Curtobacterium sp. MCSS17_007]WIE74490.1 hypothetical protein DEJ22_009365 [Curtobacterium sp. MCSS17_007]